MQCIVQSTAREFAPALSRAFWSSISSSTARSLNAGQALPTAAAIAAVHSSRHYHYPEPRSTCPRRYVQAHFHHNPVPVPPPAIAHMCWGLTDIGRVRPANEDSFLLKPEKNLYIVADGMGTHGAVASDMACQHLADKLGGLAGRPETEIESAMRGALVETNTHLHKTNVMTGRQTGTTVTALMVSGSRYIIGQVGDSRAYLLRGEQLQRITKDHSYVQDLVDAGRLTVEQARKHRLAHVITRCVGADDELEPDVFQGVLQAGDLVLLVSDGVTGMLPDSDVCDILRSIADPKDAVDALVAEANRRGGKDNVTAVIVRVEA